MPVSLLLLMMLQVGGSATEPVRGRELPVTTFSEERDRRSSSIIYSYRYPSFVSVDGLLDVNFSRKISAPGCPPPEAGRCLLQDHFDEVIVLSLPRRVVELTRIRSQLRALAVPYVLVQAVDKRGAHMQPLAEALLAVQKKAGVLALYQTQLAVFDYIQRSPLQRFLILEDDVILHRDFPRAFDAGIRRIPSDWKVLFLGANVRNTYPNSTWAAGGWFPELFEKFGYYRPNMIWGSWAIAVHRDAAKLIASTMISSRTPIDNAAYDDVFARWPHSCFVMWPAVAMTDSRTSELSHWTSNKGAIARIARNGWSPANFDTERGYHPPGPQVRRNMVLRSAGWKRQQRLYRLRRIQANKPQNQLALTTRPTPGPRVAIAVLSYDPIVHANNNLGDWLQSGAAMFAWWTYLSNASAAGTTTQRPRSGLSRVTSGAGPDSFHSLVSHAVAEDATGSSSGRLALPQRWPRVLWLERDTLQLAKRPPDVYAAVLIMNGWWMQKRSVNADTGESAYGFPPPPWVIPIFISFHIADAALLDQPSVVSYLRKHGPIGARDTSTRDLLISRGIDSYFSGCITPLLRLEDDGCAGFDSGHVFKRKCAVDAVWEAADASFKQNPSNVLMTRNATWLPLALTNYCSHFRWCGNVHTTRLHVWFPLHMNGYKASLYNKYTNERVVARFGSSGSDAAETHPGAAIDRRRTNRFAGLLEAAAGDHEEYISRVSQDVQHRIEAAIVAANKQAQARSDAGAAAAAKRGGGSSGSKVPVQGGSAKSQQQTTNKRRAAKPGLTT